ncbi:MAG: hypothetical protein IPJ81_07215 [Chitinophagaceae bacterium]|nr:hypothetical protein [Chitinophagaceae bacterium]
MHLTKYLIVNAPATVAEFLHFNNNYFFLIHNNIFTAEAPSRKDAPEELSGTLRLCALAVNKKFASIKAQYWYAVAVSDPAFGPIVWTHFFLFPSPP